MAAFLCVVGEKDIDHHHQCLTLSVQNSVISVELRPGEVVAR